MAKLTLKVTKLAFYDGGLVQPNEIIKNYKGDTIPSWATLAGGKEAPVETEDKNIEADAEKTEDVKKDADVNSGTEEVQGDADAEKTEEALMEEYNALLDEAVDKNIILEDADKKTIVEQIAELKVLLGKE